MVDTKRKTAKKEENGQWTMESEVQPCQRPKQGRQVLKSGRATEASVLRNGNGDTSACTS